LQTGPRSTTFPGSGFGPGLHGRQKNENAPFFAGCALPVELKPGSAVGLWRKGATREEDGRVEDRMPGELGSELCEETPPELELLEWPPEDPLEECCASRFRQINRIVQTTRLENRIKHLLATGSRQIWQPA